MSKTFVSQLLQELGTALNVQEIGIDEQTDFDTLDAKELANKFIKASDSKAEGVMKNYVFEQNKAKELDAKAKELEAKLATVKDESFKTGQRTMAEKMESVVKSKFGLHDSKADKFDTLIEEIEKKFASQLPQNADKSVMELQSKLAEKAKEVDSVKESYESMIEKLKSDYEQKEINAKIINLGIEKFKSLNPVLSENETKRNNQLEIVKSKLLENKWKIEGDKIFLLDEEGKIKTGDDYQNISFDQAVESITSNYFDFKASNERTAPNANQSNNEAPNNDTLAFLSKRPESEAEVLAMANDQKYSIAEKKLILQYGMDKGFIK